MHKIFSGLKGFEYYNFIGIVLLDMGTISDIEKTDVFIMKESMSYGNGDVEETNGSGSLKNNLFCFFK